jgi:uncharacterized protein (DUF2062 family)
MAPHVYNLRSRRSFRVISELVAQPLARLTNTTSSIAVAATCASSQ